MFSRTLVALLGGILFSCSAIVAEDEPDRSDLAKLRELTKPGPEHKQLSKYAGKWNVSVVMAGGRESKPRKGRGTSYMTLEGRFLWLGYNVTGKLGRLKGSFTIGYDRRNERYSLIAMDTFGTYFVTSHGKKDKETGRIKLYGKDDDPHVKAMGFDKEFVHVLDLRDDDTFSIEVHYVDTRTPERKEMKAMEFQFTRVE